MTAYIKLSTEEYPRHAGDIALDPGGEYAVVEWVAPPEIDPATQRAYEGHPINEGGSWRVSWMVRQATQEEIDEAASFAAKKATLSWVIHESIST